MENANITILLVEDHRDLAETVILYLENAGLAVDYAADGLTALHLATVNQYDALVLDVMLPGLDGFTLCQRLRDEAGLVIPILMLTARDTLEDKAQGFDGGADDYLVKPFNLPELEMRLRAAVRRYRGDWQEQVLVVGALRLDVRGQRAQRGSLALRLKPTGFRMLRILMRESPKLVTREALEHELWGDSLPDSDALRSHLYQLRKALDKPFRVPMIETVAGMGVRLVEAPADLV